MASSLKNSFFGLRRPPVSRCAGRLPGLRSAFVAGLAVAVDRVPVVQSGVPAGQFPLVSPPVFCGFDDELSNSQTHFDTADGQRCPVPSRCFSLCTVGRFICNMAAICGTENFSTAAPPDDAGHRKRVASVVMVMNTSPLANTRQGY